MQLTNYSTCNGLVYLGLQSSPACLVLLSELPQKLSPGNSTASTLEGGSGTLIESQYIFHCQLAYSEQGSRVPRVEAGCLLLGQPHVGRRMEEGLKVVRASPDDHGELEAAATTFVQHCQKDDWRERE